LIAAAVAAVTAAGCGSSTAAKGTAATPGTPAASPTATASPASCTKPCADAGGWIAQISNYKFDAQSGNPYIKPESGNVFVTLDVTFSNKTSSKKSANEFEFKLKSAGVEHHTTIGPCESWAPADVSPGSSYGPKCMAFQAASSQRSGLILIWQPGITKTYDIPLG
jgi:hypothetical protein